MKTYCITNYNSIGIAIGVGRETLIKGKQHRRVVHFTLGILFWTFIININLN
jgi:hypothetical protein